MIEQNIKWEWKENCDLSVYNICEAVQKHPATGETVWFNQATSNHCSYYQAHPKVSNHVSVCNYMNECNIYRNVFQRCEPFINEMRVKYNLCSFHIISVYQWLAVRSRKFCLNSQISFLFENEVL